MMIREPKIGIDRRCRQAAPAVKMGDMTNTHTDAKSVCRRQALMMADGTLEDFEEVVHPDAVNREAKDEPPACRGRGPKACYATALWLREAFAELH
jgi:hypothetical protein